MKYTVIIEELISEEFEINAASVEEALKFAEEKYKDGEFILAPGTLIARQMHAENKCGTEESEWMEF